MGIMVHYDLYYDIDLSSFNSSYSFEVFYTQFIDMRKFLEKLKKIHETIEEQFKERIIELSKIVYTKNDNNQFCLGFYVQVDKGCETLRFWFETDTQNNKLKCEEFSKTEYADDFINSHITTIEIIELFKEFDFSINIRDEGDYYKTRNIETLLQNKRDSEKVINTFIKVVKDLGYSVIEDTENAHFEIEGNINLKEVIGELRKKGIGIGGVGIFKIERGVD